jgi:hypothetical protein
MTSVSLPADAVERPARVAVLLALAGACTRSSQVTPSAPEEDAGPPPPPPIPIPAARECGEAGPVATPLPPRLFVTDALVSRTGAPFPIAHVQVRIDPPR